MVHSRSAIFQKPPARGKRRASFSANATLNLLRRFDPMANLDWHGLSSIARHAQELCLPADRLLVRPPRRLHGVWYLVSGTLIDESKGVRLQAGSARCRLPVYPGAVSLRSLTPVRLLFFDKDSAGFFVRENSLGRETADSLSVSADKVSPASWLEALAASPLLKFLYQRRGAAGWQSWLRNFEALDIKANQRLIEQGGRGDYFYIVQQGVALVSAGCGTELARVAAGGFFGEDALLSGQRRNASVAMPGGGRVLRGDPAQITTLVDDLWWVLARRPESWRSDNRLLGLGHTLATADLRERLADLSSEPRYGLLAASDIALQDLLLFLLVHRGYCVVLRES